MVNVTPGDNLNGSGHERARKLVDDVVTMAQTISPKGWESMQKVLIFVYILLLNPIVQPQAVEESVSWVTLRRLLLGYERHTYTHSPVDSETVSK